MDLRVTLNGTSKNHWHRYNLRQNPFPQIAKAEYVSAMMQLNSLDGEPLRREQDIGERLAGWHPEFIRMCVEQYRPGERFTFIVTIPDEVIS